MTELSPQQEQAVVSDFYGTWAKVCADARHAEAEFRRHMNALDMNTWTDDGHAHCVNHQRPKGTPATDNHIMFPNKDLQLAPGTKIVLGTTLAKYRVVEIVAAHRDYGFQGHYYLHEYNVLETVVNGIAQ